MKIVELTTENVKRLSAVHITPDGNTVVIGGKNGAGKSSVLDSIMYALGGAKTIPKSALKKGAESGKVTLKLDADESRSLSALTVTRTFEPGGKSTLEITTDDGYNAPTPQTILNDLCSRIAFDPLAFTKLQPRDQAASLREVVGLDFSDLDAQRKKLYDERTKVNSLGVSTSERAKAVVFPEDTPEVEVSASEVLERLREAQSRNQKLAKWRDSHQHWISEVNRNAKAVAAIREQLSAAEKKLGSSKAEMEIVESQLEGEEDADTAPIEAELELVAVVNAAVAKRKQRQEYDVELAKLRANSKALTKQIEGIDKEKANLMAQAQWPIPDLGFDETGVVYRGFPFEVASQAEQLEVSVAMGFAMNPGLKVLLIRDASLLDDEHLAQVAKIAEENDGQVWLERVGVGEECKVVIVDGRVATPEEVQQMREESHAG